MLAVCVESVVVNQSWLIPIMELVFSELRMLRRFMTSRALLVQGFVTIVRRGQHRSREWVGRKTQLESRNTPLSHTEIEKGIAEAKRPLSPPQNLRSATRKPSLSPPQTSAQPPSQTFAPQRREMSSSDPNNSSSTPTSAQSQTQRGKHDIAWNHVVQRSINGKNVICCLYCGKQSTGGGINRMKQHLAGRKGEIIACPKVPSDVRYQMEESLKGIVEKKKEYRERFTIENPYGGPISESDDTHEYEEIEEICRQPWERGKTTPSSLRKGKTSVGQSKKGKFGDYFAPRTTPGAQPTIKSALSGKEANSKAHMEIAKFFYDTCIPINACNSRYFQSMFDAALAIGPGYKVPSYHDLRLPLLRDAKKELQLWIDNIRSLWEESGCTIMGDGWTDNRHRTLINFLVYCPRGTIFWKSVDASNVVKDAQALFGLFQEVIEWVGPSNVVHMVTDNGSNYVAAGRLIQDHFTHINWSPCAAHCLNLVLKDIAKMDHVAAIVNQASKLTRWVLKTENFDPIDYESIDKLDVWIVDDEEEPFLNQEDIEVILYEQLDPPRMERQRRRPREDDNTNEDVDAVEVNDGIDFSSFEHFNLDDNLHDISIRVGMDGSTSCGGMNEEHEEWLQRTFRN
ncbi:hypothetical protein BUALT_Bualt09G0006700 [Buddleja alternifolia]|uniref:BED-type domain-containing protein n=1 Tax=Buddleja alternifolia TaxID=168488 RepID=A0AAV6X9K4_9LAMI|nr:hypothetical protein BUALT_Bualt09G0006700 [Buddleja alternifolia]